MRATPAPIAAGLRPVASTASTLSHGHGDRQVDVPATAIVVAVERLDGFEADVVRYAAELGAASVFVVHVAESDVAAVHFTDRWIALGLDHLGLRLGVAVSPPWSTVQTLVDAVELIAESAGRDVEVLLACDRTAGPAEVPDPGSMATALRELDNVFCSEVFRAA